MKKLLPKIVLFLFILLIYFLPSFIFKTDTEYYNSLNGVKLPVIVFPIVWTLIYIYVCLFTLFY